MPFPYNAQKEVIPVGRYRLKIVKAVEGKTKKGDPKVTCDLIITDGAWKNKHIPFHNVSFLAQGTDGAGFALSFLKAIGQPYQGKFEVDASKWVDKTFEAEVFIDEYNGEQKNKLGEVYLSEAVEDVPF